MTLIRGITYPLTIKNGSLQLSQDIDTIRDAIFAVLEVRPGELIMRPSFGCPDFVFESVQNPQIVLSRIKVALEEQIPDVEFDLSGDINSDGALQVRINWKANEQMQPPIDFELKN